MKACHCGDNILNPLGAFVHEKFSVTVREMCKDLENKCFYVNPFLWQCAVTQKRNRGLISFLSNFAVFYTGSLFDMRIIIRPGLDLGEDLRATFVAREMQCKTLGANFKYE